MSNLLYANFSRMIRNKLFLIGMGFMFFAGSFLCFQQYRQLVGYHAQVKLDSTFFTYTLMIGVISAIFCSLFVGVGFYLTASCAFCYFLCWIEIFINRYIEHGN